MTAIPQATAIDGYRWLKNDIIRGVYQPDEKLRMSLLTSRYELGVGPLREALSQLVAERLVTVVNQKGYRVAPMSEQEPKLELHRLSKDSTRYSQLIPLVTLHWRPWRERDLRLDAASKNSHRFMTVSFTATNCASASTLVTQATAVTISSMTLTVSSKSLTV